MPSPLSLVIPCYNEASRFPAEAFRKFIGANAWCRLCFVDDGSEDSTPARLGELAAEFSETVEAVTLPRNQGKAAAVRAGVLHCVKKFGVGGHVGFWDADLAVPLEESRRFLEVFERDARVCGVIGSRWNHLGVQIERRPLRHLIGLCMAFMIRRYLPFDIHDTQCGAKIFKAQDAKVLFTEPFVSRWLFDVELFKRMTLYFDPGYPREHVCEMPLREWREVAGSKLRLCHAGGVFWEFMKIRKFYRGHPPLGGYYPE